MRQAMINSGVDLAKALFRALSAEQREHPEKYFINRANLHAVGEDFARQGQTEKAYAIFEMEKDRYRPKRED